MAKIHEEVIVIKLSKLIREKDEAASVAAIANNDVCDALQSVTEELLGSGVIVEVERA